MSEFINFTVEQLQTSQGIQELNRLLQKLDNNVAGDTEAVRVFNDYGTPEGNVAASPGAIYQRKDGDINTTIYYKYTGTAATGWQALAAIPSGTIVIWSGAISAIPTGWVICDGTNSTPNLTDRFVLHADADSGGTNDVGDTGGASTHTLTTAELASHSHTWQMYNTAIGNNNFPVGGDAGGNPQGTGTSNTAGSGNAHNNRDKYYALAYIQKT